MRDSMSLDFEDTNEPSGLPQTYCSQTLFHSGNEDNQNSVLFPLFDIETT